MATTSVTVTLTSVCAGGNHLRYATSGASVGTIDAMLSGLSDPITDSEREAFVKVITKMAKAGRTVAQARTLLQTGVTVTV